MASNTNRLPVQRSQGVSDATISQQTRSAALRHANTAIVPADAGGAGRAAGAQHSADTASGYAAEDLDNLGVLYLDSTSTIGILDG
jgi:hypothetical protein